MKPHWKWIASVLVACLRITVSCDISLHDTIEPSQTVNVPIVHIDGNNNQVNFNQ